jgi:lambda family phage portal protein
VERPGQVRGVPWLSTAVIKLNDLDDFEDAELMQQKVAACFGAFVTDTESPSAPLGIAERADDGSEIDHLEPGHIAHLPPGKSITFAQPPSVQDSSFSVRVLRRIAVSIGVPYADLSGDYSQANYSSSRMERLAHWQNVSDWQEHMLIPQLCMGVWDWVMSLAQEMSGWPSRPRAQWAAPRKMLVPKSSSSTPSAMNTTATAAFSIGLPRSSAPAPSRPRTGRRRSWRTRR